MLDIPDAPILDKASLIGGCVRLPLTIDAIRLQNEVENLPPSVWGHSGGRVGPHSVAEALFLRGFAPAEGDLPVEDRPVLALLPYVRETLATLLATPLRCLLARLPAMATVRPHRDLPPYFSKTLRLHIPVVTHREVYMYASGLCYRMATGEVWALNNSATHAVWNAHPTKARTHLICDFLGDPGLLDLIARGNRHLGERIPDVTDHVMNFLPAHAALDN
jgi:hypothetical protein